MKNFTHTSAANDENYNNSEITNQMPANNEDYAHNIDISQSENMENLHSHEVENPYLEWSRHNGKIEIISSDGEKSVYIWDFIIKNGEKIPQGKGILKEQKSDGLKNWSGDFEDGKCVSGTRRTEMKDGEIREFKGDFS